MRIQSILMVTAVGVVVAGCASAPLAPRVAVMPAPGKPFEVFVGEERLCRQYAEQSVGGEIPRADPLAVDPAVLGTVVGAVAGAAIGGQRGAAVGAGGGLIAGTAAGAGRAEGSQRDVQRRYDIAYQQCMYAKGNQVPGQYVQQPAPRQSAYPPPPPPPPAGGPPSYAPPPPPGAAPPR